jgi:hypothetical protein
VRFQKTDYTCGAASVVNALLAIGVKIPEALVEELSGTDPKYGVNEHGLLKALKKLKYEYHVLPDVLDSNDAWMWLTHQLRAGHPAILSVENFSHWSSVIGMLGDSRVIYVDSQDGLESNRRENGVRSLTRRGLTRVWGSRGRGYRRKYYGIAVVPQE